MSDWFQIEKIDNTTYAISEYGHWEKVHSYLLIGDSKSILIDTGLGIGNIKKAIENLTKLPIKVITTHAHWDHIGGHSLFCDIAIHNMDADWLKFGLPIPKAMVIYNIMKEPFFAVPPDDFDINQYEIYKGEPAVLLEDGDIIDVGFRRVRIIHTPGHSPGHICLYEEDRGYLYTGDLIYKGTLDAFYPSTNPLQFMCSVDKISKLSNIKRVLPAHNSLDISPDFILQVKEGFINLADKNVLKQGNGIFEFEEFKIHL
jgi:glyoxylase-like metal-dependent hydrolase (beta-lactamase superfamily II)